MEDNDKIEQTLISFQSYSHRWHVLAAFSLLYFFWSFEAYRYIGLTAEFAYFYSVTNEVSFDNGSFISGMDSLLSIGSFSLLLSYPIGGLLNDRFGLGVMKLGGLGLAATSWWWYLSGRNFDSVQVSRLFSSLAGGMVVTSLLRISKQWFPPRQRALAVAIGAISSTVGAACGLVIFPAMRETGDFIDFRLISCLDSFQENFFRDNPEYLNFTAEELFDEQLECTDDAEEDFCCSAQVDIEFINFILAIMGSVIALYTFWAVRDDPPIPPSPAGQVKPAPTISQGCGLCFSKERFHYVQLCLADFIASGPVIVLFSTISRIFPARVSAYTQLVSATSLVVSLPAGLYFSLHLAKVKKYFDYTSKGYLFGFLAWTVVTAMVAIDESWTDAVVLVMAFVAILSYVLWTISVYELKIEYVFSSDYSLEGFVIAVDRVIINLSSLVFVASIPPERYSGPAISGRLFTFLVGAVCMFIGVVLIYTIKDKRNYLRVNYEEEYHKGVEDQTEEAVQAKPEIAANIVVEAKEEKTSL
eukprot:maker-scaffold_53-snap-gene-1.3-mRNA-1 protein AED:0.00 eAED:0.00 QI:245/1/1/1/0.5/0.33/3/20/528